jgi:hypothetical protein
VGGCDGGWTGKAGCADLRAGGGMLGLAAVRGGRRGGR